jgi:DNA-binding SARP family transcriptional activator
VSKFLTTTGFREQYQRRLLDAHQALADLLRVLEPELALSVLDRAISMEPWNQRLHETLIGIHLELGQRHAAERRYHDFADFLAQLGTSPDERLDALMTAPAGGGTRADLLVRTSRLTDCRVGSGLTRP